MRLIKKILLTSVICSSFLLFQCEKVTVDDLSAKSNDENNSISAFDLSSNSQKVSDEDILLGRKLINPYAIVNMEKALKSLKGKGVKTPSKGIKTNYLYVRLLAKTDAEYDSINSDSTIDTYEYPLDFEIIKQGNRFKDKTLENNKFTWIYCAIPVGKKFDSKIKMEILDELYLPFGNGKVENEFEITDYDFLKLI